MSRAVTPQRPKARLPRRTDGAVRGVRVGGLCASLALILLLLSAAGGAALLALPSLLFEAFRSSQFARHALAGALGWLSAIAVLASVQSSSLRRLQEGTRGRARLLLMTGAAAAFPVCVVGFGILVFASLERGQLNPFERVVALRDMVPVGSSLGWRGAAGLLTTLGAVSLLALLVTAIGSWFLVPRQLRRGVFVAFDAVIASFLVASVLTEQLFQRGLLSPVFPFERHLPLRVLCLCLVVALGGLVLGRLRLLFTPLAWLGRALLAIVAVLSPLTLNLSVPDGDPTQVVSAGVLLSVLAILVVRVHAVWLPVIADAVEGLGLRPLVAVRHLRSRKSDFLALIGVISIVAIMTACAVLTLVLSVMGGFRNDLKQKIIGNNAHVVIDADGDTFDDWRTLLRRVRGIAEVAGATPFVTGEVMVTSATNLSGAILRGIDPDSVGSVVDLERNLTQGRLLYLSEPGRLLSLPPEDTLGSFPFDLPYPEPEGLRHGTPKSATDAGTRTRSKEAIGGAASDRPAAEWPTLDARIDPLPRRDTPSRDSPQPDDAFLSPPFEKEVLPGIIVGRELARSLRLFLGDEVNVVSPFGSLGPQGPMPKSRPFRVAGVFYSGMYEYDMKYLYVSLTEAQRFLSVGDQVSGVELKTAHIDRAPTVAAAVRRRIAEARATRGPSLRVQDWRQLNQNLFGALELERLSMFILLGFAIVTAGFCVFATVTLMVREKRPQVGILLAMGSRTRTIVGVFLLEGLLLGGLGAELGLGLGYLACFAVEHFGLRMDPEVYYIDRLPVHLDGGEFALVGSAALLISMLSTLFPATLASRLRPVDALRPD